MEFSSPTPDSGGVLETTYWKAKQPSHIMANILEHCTANAKVGQEEYEKSLIPP
jgi:hypothetical protein